MSIKRVPLFGKKKKKKPIKRADERREGTLPVFCIPSSSLWASLMCLPQSLFWLPPAVSFSPLHWRGFWLTKIKHELLGFLLATLNTDHRCASFPASYTHQGCTSIGGEKNNASAMQILPKRHLKTARTERSLDALRPWCRLPSRYGRSKLILSLCLGAASPPSRLLLVINVCTDITPYFKGLLTQQQVDLFSTHNLLIRTITCSSPACEKAA